jgi:hypothetical protein
VPADEVSKARAVARPLVKAEGWTDADIGRLIEEDRETVPPRLETGPPRLG